MNLELVLDPTSEVISINATPLARLHHYFERRCDATPHATALICDDEQLTYADLDTRANQLAHYLINSGIQAGDRIGILLERSTHSYATLLAILKAGAAFVPIDPGCPAQRVAFIASDAGLALLVTTTLLTARLAELPCTALILDAVEDEIRDMPSLGPDLRSDGDALAYILYTSGTTGQPKGVAVNHSNICFFLNACTPIYRVRPNDRVYQGMTLAFDFSIEEIWPTFIAGATLIAGPTDGRRMGSALADFLREHRVTVLYCVPTLLATLDHDVPSLRMLIVGGEACPEELVECWAPRVQRMLNTYGPTETTVTATWTELVPGEPVTIGKPIPGYRVHILDESLQPVAPGAPGEICIGGPGVAQGYINRPGLTAQKFMLDPFDPHGRLYRSGDLGRFTPDGNLEFLGRIDSQAKLRGFRVELSEIEAVLLEDAAVENAVVSTIGSPPSDLAAYITLRNHTVRREELRERLAGNMRCRLPCYMLPAWIEILHRIPALPSGKADRTQLPPPASSRLIPNTTVYVEPATPVEETIASVWRSIFGHPELSVEADFFLDLGGHSLFAAQVTSRLRQQPGLSHLSVADVYAHPTIRQLASAVAGNSERVHLVAPGIRHSTARVWTAGLIQLTLLYAFLGLLAAPGVWLFAGHAHARLSLTIQDLAVPPLILLLSLLLPIALKWTLIGRFRAGTYPLWGWYYCRLWLVRKAIELSPIHCFAGSPLLAPYARMLGARIGRNCHIATSQLHLPDLIDIGDGVSIGYDVELQPFVVQGGNLELAPIRVGEKAFIGTKSVLLAGAEIGPRSRVAEQSLVGRNAKLPAGQSWHGSPLSPCAFDPLLDNMESQPPAPEHISLSLWTGYLAGFAALESVRLLIALPGLLLLAGIYRAHGLAATLAATPLAALLFVLTACVLILVGKRILMPQTPSGLHPVNSWFGLRKWLIDQLMLTSLDLTNTLYATLYTLPWLRAMGARIGPRSEVSTVSHIDPDLLVLDSETFVADLASVGAATFHNGYISTRSVAAGSRTFIGNAAVVPSGVELPANCLIGVASVPPGERPAPGSSWLGSPAMFLPKRQVCEAFSDEVTYHPTSRLLVYRLVIEFWRVILPSALLYLLGIVVAFGSSALLSLYGIRIAAALMPALYFVAAFGVTLLSVALKWMVAGKYRPRIEPLWAPFVRHTELVTGTYESVAVPALIGFATGTPWAAPLLRLFGAHIGRRVWIDTTYLTEFDLVRIGDDTAIGRASSLQTHLFEDRVMKMSTVSIGAACVIGPRSVVLYDSEVNDNARLDGLSLVMKGESLPASTTWSGIPARHLGGVY